jgi:hypothetical protein
MSKSVISARIAAAQKCADFGAFSALHPVYGRKFGPLILELARMDRGGLSVWISPEEIANRLGVSRATFYRILDAAMSCGLVAGMKRSRVGTRLRVNWPGLGPVFNAALRMADAVRMKAGRYRQRVAVAGETLRRMCRAGFGSSHAEAGKKQDKIKIQEKAPCGPSSVSLSVSDYLALCAARSSGRVAMR